MNELLAQKFNSTNPLVQELYKKIFDAFRFSLQHFNQYQFEREFTTFVEKLVDISDYIDNNAEVKSVPEVQNLQSQLQYVMEKLEQAYQLFMNGRGVLDEVMENSFPTVVDTAENLK